MAKSLEHRGPDGEGVWSASWAPLTLGHRLLAIRSLLPAAAQPMVSEDGLYALSYNGELYGTDALERALGSRGVVFRGGGDAETLFHALRTFGVEETLSRISGEFAFVWADGYSSRVFMVRDPVGVHPLYYACFGGKLAFGSEQKALLELPWVDRAPRIVPALRFLLTARTDDVPFETFVSGIDSLPAGHCAVWDGTSLKVHRFQRGDVDPPVATYEDVRRELDRAVAQRLVSERPVGVLVSGGLDSSAVALIADRARVAAGATAPMHVFCFHDKAAQEDERAFQLMVLGALKSPHQVHWVSASTHTFARELDAYVAHQEDPYGDASSYAEFCIAREASKFDVRVLLNGLGGDEVFLGYPAYFGPLLDELVVRGEFRSIASLFLAAPGITRLPNAGLRLTLAGLYHALPPRIRNSITALRAGAALQLPLDWYPAIVGDAYDRWHAHDGASSTNAILRGSIESWTIPRYLLHSDRMTMASGVETRVPLLDGGVIKAAFGIPPRMRVGRNGLKSALRHALADLYPPAIRDRAWKLGFHVPLATYVESVDESLRHGHARTCELLNAKLRWDDLTPQGKWRSGMTGLYLGWLSNRSHSQAA